MNLGELVATGNTANLYEWNNKIVKIFKENLPPTESFYEAKKQEYAYSCGLNVPEIFEVRKVNGLQAIIMEFIEGETLGHLLLKNLNDADRYINVLVKVQKRIHEVKVESDEIERMDEKISRKIESAPSLNKSQKSMLLNKLNSLKYEPRLCHGDLHPFNLIMNEEVVSIIDWVDATAGDIRADVCRTYLLIAQHSLDLAELYLQLYCCNINISKSEIRQWMPIIAGARLAEIVSSEDTQRLMDIVNQFCNGCSTDDVL
ncbi:phosphotransferase family protein [Solibacillus sp. FSL K6-4121]|uniref:phosphotransferase family protein n=1 Tax=Solibacillus sp. FSL K6-4121 TaxID=2921505 RepID=UPI0030F53564